MRILLVTFDCLPRRHFGCYGGMEFSTRGFDTIAAHGTVFDGCFSVDVSAPKLRPYGLEALRGGDDGAVRADGQDLTCALWTPAPRERGTGGLQRLTVELNAAAHWLAEPAPDSRLAWVRHSGLRGPTWPLAPENEGQTGAKIERLDAVFGVFFERWRALAADEWRLLIVGSSGLLLRTVAAPAEAPGHSADLLCDDLVHVPMWLVTGAGELYGRRRQSLVSSRDVGRMIAGWLAPTNRAADRLDGDEFIAMRGPQGTEGLRTANWFYRRAPVVGDSSAGRGLFKKPEDVFDHFNVASLYEEMAVLLDRRLTAIRGEGTPDVPGAPPAA